MIVNQAIWSEEDGWTGDWDPTTDGIARDLIFLFGSRNALAGSAAKGITDHSGSGIVVGCSTAGEICGTRVVDNSLVATAVKFHRSNVRGLVLPLPHNEDSHDVGLRVAHGLLAKDLRHVVVFSEGIHVNGSELVRGLESGLAAGVGVTGGLSGDGESFQETWVVYGDSAKPRGVAAVGFYGSALTFGCASMGGWDAFGTDRLVTRSVGNILYELDGAPALDLYRRYLGDQARDLPASGLLYPISLRDPNGGAGVVRTMLSIDDKEGSLSFAGDIPMNSYVRLMKANFNRLVDGASGAAKESMKGMNGQPPALALLISCVGRKMVLKQRIEDEVESVREVLGSKTCLAGFYSYGEISPFTPEARCQLHNQTMTITTISEA